MPIVGIDLGTTFSSLAVLGQDGVPHIEPDEDGDRLTPSVVYFPPDGSDALVGEEARKMLAIPDEQENVVEEIKRKMGSSPYEELPIGATPVGISASILKRLISSAARIYGEIDEVVISVPASSGDEFRKATVKAGELAGIGEVKLVNEPVAAAVFYATTQPVKGRVLVYDLGGGTFDVAIVEIEGKDVDVRASTGEPHLGGKDFDRAICGILDEKHHDEYDEWLYEGCEPDGFLMCKAEELKISLSRREEVEWVGEGGRVITITREEFEAAIIGKISEADDLIDDVLGEYGLNDWDIDFVLLVGGSTRIPLVTKVLGERFGQDKIRVEVNPDEAVARGAAVYSGWRNPDRLSYLQEEAIRPLKIQNVLGRYYGTVALERLGKDIGPRLQKLVAPGSMARDIAEELKEGYLCGLREPYVEFCRLTGPDSVARVLADEVIEELPGKNKLRERRYLWAKRAVHYPELLEYAEYIGGAEGKSTALGHIRAYVLKVRTRRATKALVESLAKDRYQEFFIECRESWVERAKQVHEVAEFAKYISGLDDSGLLGVEDAWEQEHMLDEALELIGDVVLKRILLREGKYEAERIYIERFSRAQQEGRKVGKRINSIILRGTHQIPCRKTRKYFTAAAGQTSLTIEVTESIGDVRDLNSPKVKIILRDVLELPADHPADSPVEVAFEFDEGSMLICTYTDVVTGEQKVLQRDCADDEDADGYSQAELFDEG